MDRPPFEKRASTRTPEPDCPTCNSPKPTVTLRTPFVVYYRCEKCGEIWNVIKPGMVGDPT